MDLSILDNTAAMEHAVRTTAGVRASRVEEGVFASHLDKARRQAREASEQLVASTLLLPLLQQMRNDPFKTDMFHGGSAEDIFGAQLDTQLADRMAASMRLPVVEQVYERITRQMEARQAVGAGGRIDRHG